MGERWRNACVGMVRAVTGTHLLRAGFPARANAGTGLTAALRSVNEWISSVGVEAS
jgi:hypothetical protein